MDAATAWAEAMKFANRPNPYPFYEELRKTPVAKVADHTYVVTGYPEALALAHDPRISSDVTRSPSGLFGEKPETATEAIGAEAKSFIVSSTGSANRRRLASKAASISSLGTPWSRT